MAQRTKTTLLLFAFFFVSKQSLALQETNIYELPDRIAHDIAEKARDEYWIGIRVDTNGSFYAGTVSRDRVFRERQLPYYESDGLWREMELSKEQKEKIKDVVKNWRREHNKTYHHYNRAKGEINERVRIMDSEMLRIATESQEEILEKLSTLQKRRLAQLRFRFLVRNNGLIKTLTHRFSVEALRINQSTIKKLRLNASNVKKEFDPKIAEVFKKAVRTFLKPLSDEQREHVFAKWTYLKPDSFPEIDRLRVHLTYFTPYKILDRYKDAFEKNSLFPNYRIDQSGKIHPNFGYEKQPAHFIADSVLRRKILFLSGKLAKNLHLSEFQKKQVKSLVAYYYEQENLSWMPKDKRGGLSFEQFVYKMVEDIEAKLDKILLKPQKKAWNKIPEKALSLKYGPVYDLIHGPLGADIDLPDEVKKSLQASAKEALAQLEEDLIKLEDQWIQGFIQPLPEKQKRQVKSLIGNKLKHFPPLVFIYKNEK